MKIINKKFITIIFLLLFSINKVYATGLPVFDATSAANFVQQMQSLQQMIEHNTEMAKKVGDGNFTPSTINWMNRWYTKCGGGKYVLPDWFPHPKLNICGDGKQTIEASVKWYKANLVILKSDSLKEAEDKSKEQEEALIKIRTFALSKSIIDMQRAEEDQKAIAEFQKGLGSANDQIKIQKVQTQVMIQMLAELQRLNQQQAHMIQLTAIKN